MSLAIDVNLPKSHVAKFPDKCVACGKPHPNGHVRLITSSIGWWSWLLWAFGTPFVVKAPACKPCGWLLQWRRLMSVIMVIAIVAIVFEFVWPHVAQMVGKPWRKWAMFGVGLLFLIPFWLLEMIFFLPSFSITAHSDSVDYEFRDARYARDFAALNIDAEWVKID